MKSVVVKILGKERHLVFTGGAMFQVRDVFGGTKQLLEAVYPDTKEGLKALCQAACILAEQGELGRRALGYDKTPMLSCDVLEATISPAELVELKAAIPKAIELGYGREIVPENNEIDLGLAELNQKKTKN